MKFFDRKSAIKTFYYLMAIDGDVTPEESEQFGQIGNALDPEGFASYKEELINTCAQEIGSVSGGENFYESIQQLIGSSMEEADPEKWVPARLVIWNMLVLAMTDDHFDEVEKKLIRYVVSVTETDNSIYMEMEQYIKTYMDIEQELDWLNQSEKPYVEIRPHVDEIEKRKQTIQIYVKELIEDEKLSEMAPVKEEPDRRRKMDDTRKAMADILGSARNTFADGSKKMAGAASELGSKAQKGFSAAQKNISEKAWPRAEDLKGSAARFLGKLKGTAPAQTLNIPKEYEDNGKTDEAFDMIPKGTPLFKMINESTNVNGGIWDVPLEQSMNFDNPKQVIKDLHDNMEDCQGIVEVNHGAAQNGGKYIYSITKLCSDDLTAGVSYVVEMCIQINSTIKRVYAVFDEIGTTGLRAAMAYEIYRNTPDKKNLTIEEVMKEWTFDPYDPEYRKGFLMNHSEDRVYDAAFPKHPLTEARKFVTYVIRNN